MAEEESGGNSGNKIKALLTRKVAGIPAYILLLIAVLILAWYLKRRAAAKAATPDTTGQNAAAGQTFPYASPMNYSSDVFVNNQAAPPNGGVPQTVPIGTDTNLATWLANINAQYPNIGLTEDKFRQLNPNIGIALSNVFGYLRADNPANRPGGGAVVKTITTTAPGTQVRIQ